jgi:hypothetical protein
MVCSLGAGLPSPAEGPAQDGIRCVFPPFACLQACGEDPLACVRTREQRNLPDMDTDVLYADSLVEISAETILFRRYYFPIGARRLKLSDIERVIVRTPTFATGKYRLQGSGGLRTWFPMDLQRPKRRKIFILILRNKWHRIGFTVEDEATVERVLRERQLL